MVLTQRLSTRNEVQAAITVEILEKPGLFRVLVGPLADGSLNKTEIGFDELRIPG